jgi:hypothetical protein
VNLLQAMDDPQVFAPHFRNAASWMAWRAFLTALFALPMNESERRIYRRCTGREKPPKEPCREAWLVIGRRGGKSFTLAVIATFLATFRDWRPFLGPGERATVMVIAADRRQARVVMRYIRGLLKQTPMLARTIEREATESIDLARQVTIEVHTASYRTTRGYSVCAALLDEVAFWPTDNAAEPDVEIIAALKPAMATIPGSVLLAASSPYSRKGALWDAYRRHHGQDGPILVWQAPSRTMNPSIPQRLVDDALAEDPAHASAEWLAQFRTDVETFVAREAVEACVSAGIRERMILPGVSYRAFVDPSGGSSDSMTLAVAHRQGERMVVLDAVREVRPPFSPETVVTEFCQLLQSYGISSVCGDRYAGEWPREQFRKHGVTYQPAEKAKSDLYRDLLPMLNSGRVELLDHPRLIHQLVSLERRTSRGGRDTIDHPPNAHDDVANAVAGAIGQASKPARTIKTHYVRGLY